MHPPSEHSPIGAIDASRPPALGFRRALWWTWRVVSLRLRFLILVGLAFGVVVEWDALANRFERLTRGAAGLDATRQAVSSDTEYFCPMDPGVLSDWPSKCGICNMALVRRKRGDVAPLPEGVVARMQFTPYRLQLAGIRTSVVGYRPLVREVEGPGLLREEPADPAANASDRAHRTVDVALFANDLAEVALGQAAEVRTGTSEPLRGVLRGIRKTFGPGAHGAVGLIDVIDPRRALRPGENLSVRIQVPIATLEPFRSMPTQAPAPRPGEPRRVYACGEHRDVVSLAPGACPRDRTPLARENLAANQRVRWWCPMHPDVTADLDGATCKACGGMKLVPRVVAYNPPGEILAVPESAVVDGGVRAVVFVERMPGMFEGREVVLGPRCGDAYPVVRGLEAGMRVVTSGAFLVDAETRLNAGASAAYFGASVASKGAAQSSPASVATARDEPRDPLTPADRAAIARQKICPVTREPLGSMGDPVRIAIGGRTIYLCCSGCTAAIKKNPSKYLGNLGPEARL